MKKIARLALFFSLCFALSLAFLCLSGFLRLWVEYAAAIPARQVISLVEFLNAVRWTFPFALYFSILLGASYAVRLGVFSPAAIITLLALAEGFSWGAVEAFRRTREMTTPPLVLERATLGGEGLKLRGKDAVMIFLTPEASELSARVIARDGQPLEFTRTPEEEGPLPQAPFSGLSRGAADAGGGRLGLPGVFTRVAVDCAQSARELERRRALGALPFSLYAAALALLLVSLWFVLNMGAWPLANLFVGALVFRVILAFEVFVDSAPVQDYLGAFLGRILPPSLISPALFGALGVLVVFYQTLVFLARERKKAAA